MLRVLADSLLALTLSGNVILGLMLWRNGWYIRFGWLTASAWLSVLSDLVLQHAKYHVHPHFEPLRQFLFYTVFVMLYVCIIWEGWRWKNKAVEYLTGGELFLLILWLSLRGVKPWWAYYSQFVAVGFNLVCIIWFIIIFRREAHYELAR